MMFTLKKLISSFLMPLPIGVILLVVAIVFLYKKSYLKSKIFIILSCLWFVLLSYEPVSNRLLLPLESSYKDLKVIPNDVKYIIVLGNGYTSNEQLSITSQLSQTALNRFLEGYRIYKNLPNSKLIFSGYKGPDKISHAIMQKKLALSLNVNSEDIITIDKPKDTAQEAVAIKNLLHDKKFILVTSASHMKRAMRLFKKLRLNAIAAPTNHLAKDKGNYISSLKSYNLYKSKVAFHEYLGLLWEDIKELLS
ncbi:YdcF-like membrane protein (DUF218 domain) [Malaciobacter molluscorum LMG 25693]|uniref:YdcF-like membrane protein (DUF218 domain) n=2 Tax=Malaciobacter molluscorum LMG 25693 TaxID=870501 RepID=A0AB33GXL6_9BACT|nr:envelope biogenesis factor ElyC [Malaciobacter molluscorum]AXX91589.1 YdcF-like membrane protein (DUF218 domain) [Malaciobacter molluscorum LMG 25693]